MGIMGVIISTAAPEYLPENLASFRAPVPLSRLHESALGVLLRVMPRSRLLALLLVSLTGGGFAQDITQRYAPKPPPEAPGVPHALPPEPANPATDTRPLIPKLNAIVFVPNKAGLDPADSSETSGIHRDGLDVPAPAEFDQLAGKHLGNPLSLASLNQLVRELILFWRAHDRPVVDVVVPEQDITLGVLHLIVMESRAGKVRVEGARWFAPRKLARKLRIGPGDRIRASVLNADLDWLNTNSFRRVNLIYTPGADVGTTDLVLKTEDRLPVRAYLGYEDTGVAPTINRTWLRNRWLAGVNWGNAFGADQLLSYQFTTSDDFTNVRAHALSYAIPLPWRHTLSFSASYSKSETTTGSTLLNGVGWGGSLRYTVPLPGAARFAESLAVGFDWSRSNSNLDFGGLSQYSKPIEIRQIAAEYQASLQDGWGATALGASFYYGPGNWTPANADSRFAQARQAADSNYSLGRFTLERVTRLPWNWSISARGGGQIASGPLVPAEAYYIGGWDSVRGYEQADTHGDEGVTLALELRTPPIGLGRWFHWKSAPDQFQWLTFLDYGTARVLQPLPGEPRTSERCGAGIGVRYTVGRWVSFRCDYAWQLIDPGPIQTVSNTFAGRTHIGLTISY